MTLGGPFNMQDTEPPTVPRFNAWREWKPILARFEEKPFRAIQDEINALDSPDLKAVYAYCKYTGFDCIEFVILANFIDTAPVRRYPGGLIVVPCDDVLSVASGRLAPGIIPRGEYIYDAWFPVPAATPIKLRDALGEIDDTVTFIARSYGVAARWIPKYLETMLPPTSLAKVKDADWERHADVLSRFKSLPHSVRPAISRVAHWLLRAKVQRMALDRFLYMWFGLEGLLLTLYEHATDVELPLVDETTKRSKSQQREAKNQLIHHILAKSLNDNPIQAVTEAYFQGVVSIRRRSEAVLRAALGKESPFVTWLYTGSASPSQLRSKVVHEGESSHKINNLFPVEQIVQKLEQLTNELIVRTMRRIWRGDPLPITVPQSMIMPISPNTSIMAVRESGPTIQGDFRITHGLLALKGLL